ncbi:hypothetical protein V6N11_002296 [Hibiscus sabdariffa]|uniref:RING-type domain-containing protein n=2 Tax=Hibiscus sabdariffa TaxID=183260 RepID=A0ABR2CZU9_9ROSI
MGIALAFSTLTLVSFVVYFVYFNRRYLPRFILESTLFGHVVHKLGRCTEQTTTTGTARSRQRRRVLHGADNDDGYWKLAASADAGTECPFCSYEVEEGEEICMLICGHVFHRFCLETRARHPNPACPLCRGPPELTGSLVHEIYREEMLRFSSFAPLMTRRHRWWLRL